MSEQIRQLAQTLLEHGRVDLTALERSLLERLSRRPPLSRDPHADYEERLTFGQRLADQIARFGGSWGFILLFMLVLAAWVLINTVVLLRHPFDPYPFIFLNLILSMLAAVQAPVIMMSQNRQAEKDRVTAAHDYEVNLKAELEIMALHEKLDRMRDEQLAALLVEQHRQLALIERLLQEREARG
ncbi:MAG: DUF1003 domain-containing protein [Lysobacter sp.]|nr:DUF1003 domain-containing protein [Lysobacter sp.]